MHENPVDNPTISIVIPCYNLGNYVAQAIESALDQTLPANEIIVIDDCSTDNSLSVIDKYSNITALQNSSNLGHIATFNRGIDATSSDFFVVLSADDLLTPDFLEKHIEIYRKDPKHVIYYCDFEIIGSRSGEFAIKNNLKPIGGRYFLEFPEPTSENLKNLKTKNFLHGSVLCSKKWFDKLSGYRKTDIPEDLDFGIRTVDNGGTVCHVPFPLLQYRQHSISQTHSQRLHQEVENDLKSYTQRTQRQIEELNSKNKQAMEELESLVNLIGFNSIDSYNIQKESKTMFYRLTIALLKTIRSILNFYKVIRKITKVFKK